MERIDYFRVFAFLAFMGSAFLSTVFHYPVFTIFWFFIMILFIIPLTEESSEMTILAFTAFAYVPLGLISVFSNYLDKTPYKDNLSQFAWFLIAFLVIEIILAAIWISKTNFEEQ